MESGQINSRQAKEDITLKSLLFTGKAYGLEILRSWKLIVFVCLVVLIVQTIRYIQNRPTYTAELSFMVNEDRGQQIGSLSGVLGQIGLGPMPSEYNLDRILELVRSRRITESVLFYYESVNGNQDLLANHFITHLDSLGKWSDGSWPGHLLHNNESFVSLKDFRFPDHSVPTDSEKANKALKKIYKLIIGERPNSNRSLLKSGYNESSGIMKISVSTFDPGLSIALTNQYFKELSDFYIEKSIEKQQRTYGIIKAKYDSIQNELQSTQLQLAQFKDRSKGMFSYTSQLEENRLMNKSTILTAGLAEATKNLEVADFALQNKMPFVQLIDAPVAPLDSDKHPFLETIVISVFFALILSFLFIIARKFFREALKE